jgi:hypothetical protein
MTRHEWEIVKAAIIEHFYSTEDDYERISIRPISEDDFSDMISWLEWKGVTINDLPSGEGPRLTSVREAVQNSQRGM